MFCQNCGQEVNEKAVVCVKCGCPITPYQVQKEEPTTIKKEEPTTTNEKPTLSFSVISIIIALFVGIFSLLIPSVLKLTSFFLKYGIYYHFYTFKFVYVVFAFTMAVSVTNLVFLFINAKKEKQKFTFILSIIINLLMLGLCLTMFLVTIL